MGLVNTWSRYLFRGNEKMGWVNAWSRYLGMRRWAG
jgi:hypothetical protein